MIEAIFLTSSILTGLIGLMILASNPWRTINQAYVFAASLGALWLLCIFMTIHAGLRKETEVVRFWLRMTNVVASFLPWSYSLIKISITGNLSLRHSINKTWPWAIVGASLAFLVFSDFYFPNNSTSDFPKRGIGYSIHIVTLTISCTLLVTDAYKEMRACSGIRLLEMKFFAINICISTLAILASIIAGNVFNISQLRYAAPFVVVISYGLTVCTICYHRIFDARQVLAALSRRISTLMVLAIFVIVIDALLSSFLTNRFRLLISACCAGLMATYWDRKARDWLGMNPRKILSGPRAQIIEYAREEADVGKLTTKFEAFLREWCNTELVTFHTLESHEAPSAVLKTSDYARAYPFLRQTGYVTTEMLARRRPDQEIQASRTVLRERSLAALIAVPRGSVSPSCVVAFGPKHSLRPYTYPDIQLLIELVELMDNILTQARVATRTAQIEKMEAAAMMSRGLAHDLNNLATPVSTFLMHMEDRVKPGSAEEEVLADAKHSIRVMQDYIRESLFFARRLVPDFQRLSPGELLESTIKSTQSRAQARGVAVGIGETTDASFTGDRALMQRLLQNLVFNGIDATPPGGRVTLSAAIAAHDRIHFSVTDEGPGVPAEIIDRVFEPYFTTKDTGDHVRGLGLGLAICLKISGLHNGEISIGKTTSGGAIFTASLPLNPRHPSNASSVNREPPGPLTAIPAPAIGKPAL